MPGAKSIVTGWQGRLKNRDATKKQRRSNATVTNTVQLGTQVYKTLGHRNEREKGQSLKYPFKRLLNSLYSCLLLPLTYTKLSRKGCHLDIGAERKAQALWKEP